MRLSNYFSKVERDAEFVTLALANHQSGEELLTYVEDEKHLKMILQSECFAAAICTPGISESLQEQRTFGVVISDKPKESFYDLHNRLAETKDYIGSRVETSIAESCHIHKNCTIATENVVIGENVVIEEGVRIKDGVRIGDNCIIRANSVIGGTGLQFYKSASQIIGVRHLGYLVIGNNVEIQNLCEVQKGVFPWQSTTIGDQTKIGGLTCIGHASQIGCRTMIANGTMVAGSVCIGNDVWIGNNATISSQVIVKDNARVSIGSVVMRNVKKGPTVTGNPAVEHSMFLEDQLQLFRRSKKV